LYPSKEVRVEIGGRGSDCLIFAATRLYGFRENSYCDSAPKGRNGAL